MNESKTGRLRQHVSNRSELEITRILTDYNLYAQKVPGHWADYKSLDNLISAHNPRSATLKQSAIKIISLLSSISQSLK